MSKKQRIGLYGIGGVYNFGCEAIVRGAVKLIYKIYKDPEVIYFSYNYEYDKKILADQPISVYDLKRSKDLIIRIKNKICKLIKTEKRPLFIEEASVFNKIDEIWSIGGDIYTIPEIKRNRRVYDYYNSLIDFCNRAIGAGKKVVLYGASVGPFGKYEKAINYYKDNLLRYQLILCREDVSIMYLKSIGVENTIFFPDPAFQVEGIFNTDVKKEYIGMNFSPLSLNEVYGNHGIESQEKIAKLIKMVADEFNLDILLIPHVISKDENDDDLRFLQSIIKFLPGKYSERVKIANHTQGFLGVKEQIRNCRFVVAARMHCCINAIVEDVPTIFLSYSQKSKGMCEYVYGNTEWIVSIKEIESDLIDKMKSIDTQVDAIQIFLHDRNVEIRNEYLKIFDELGAKI